VIHYDHSVLSLKPSTVSTPITRKKSDLYHDLRLVSGTSSLLLLLLPLFSYMGMIYLAWDLDSTVFRVKILSCENVKADLPKGALVFLKYSLLPLFLFSFPFPPSPTFSFS